MAFGVKKTGVKKPDCLDNARSLRPEAWCTASIDSLTLASAVFYILHNLAASLLCCSAVCVLDASKDAHIDHHKGLHLFN